jgi:inner membrane protein
MRLAMGRGFLPMATPLGHALAGYAVYNFTNAAQGRGDLSLTLLCVFMATAPDLDFLPGLLVGKPALYHQGITHSLGAALLASLAAAGVWGLRRRSFLAVFRCCFIAYLSHLILDLLGTDKRPPYGIPLLWPISNEHFVSPVPILLGVRHAATATTPTQEWALALLHPHNLAAIAWETIVVLPFIWLGQWHRRVSLN